MQLVTPVELACAKIRRIDCECITDLSLQELLQMTKDAGAPVTKEDCKGFLDT
jgi:hypothetical protein